MNVTLATMTGSNPHYYNKFNVVYIILNFFHAIGKKSIWYAKSYFEDMITFSVYNRIDKSITLANKIIVNLQNICGMFLTKSIQIRHGAEMEMGIIILCQDLI